jgi:pyruvate dehydrogenase E2 component (dihydrolipoamide acetyltransferase)
VSLQGSRRVVAEAMSEAWRTIPHITDLREVDVAGLLRARRLLKERLLERGAEEAAAALTVFAILAKVTAEVAAAHPAVNATVDIENHEITYHGRVDLNVAVSTPNGLLAPVVRNAESLSLPTIALELGRLGVAARERSLAPVDLARGTITASNYGSLGSPSGTTIIQPGQTAIVGFGHTTEKAVVRDGEIVVGSVMQVHCSGDHRAMDGLELQAFTAELAATLEDPVLLLAGRD